jgi:hypothetical protein
VWGLRRIVFREGLLIAGGLACSVAGASGASKPGFDVSTVVGRSVLVNNADWSAQPAYSFLRNDVKGRRDLVNLNPSDRSKLYEVTTIEGSPYERLVAINNHPLGSLQQQEEQNKLENETLRRQGEPARERKARLTRYREERAGEHLLMQQMIAAFAFEFVGEEEIDGIVCYVLDAKPNPEYRPPVEKAKVLTGMKGRLWIDKAQYHWVKVKAEVIKPVEFGFFIATVKPGTTFELRQAPVGGVWLPKIFLQTVNASVLGFYGLQTSEETYFSAYRQVMLNANSRDRAR